MTICVSQHNIRIVNELFARLSEVQPAAHCFIEYRFIDNNIHLEWIAIAS